MNKMKPMKSGNAIRMGCLVLLMCACGAKGMAQRPPASPSPWEKGPGVEGFNAATLAVLVANRPKDMVEADWLKLMANPLNAVLYPLRVTQEMLDTLDGRKMDLRYRYVMVE
ncbi:MAG: hypothetical protein JST45_06140 [Bacteroidetes bacterium]|nr:hypothetical protein [Bacteroidota bacterium]